MKRINNSRTAGNLRPEFFSSKRFVAFVCSRRTATTRQCGWGLKEWYSAGCSTTVTHSLAMDAGGVSKNATR